MNPVVRQAYLRELEELQKEAALLPEAVHLGASALRAGLGRAGSAAAKVVTAPLNMLNRAAGTEATLFRSGYTRAAGGGWSKLAPELNHYQALAQWNPARVAQGFGQRMWEGAKATGNIVRHPLKQMRAGWDSAGILARNEAGQMTSQGAGVGMKALGGGYVGYDAYKALKPGADPYDPDAGRAERIGRALGGGAGFIGGQTGGMVAAMTASSLLGYAGGQLGKGVDKSVSGIRSLVKAREQEAGPKGSPGAPDMNPVRRANTTRQGLSG